MQQIRIMCVLLAGWMLVGCAAMDDTPSPSVALKSIRLTDRSDEGSRVEVFLELSNPGKVALPLVNTSYTVTVAGGRTYSFEDESNRTLPAQGKQTLMLPAAFAIPGDSISGQQCNISGTVTYEPPGEIRKILTESGVPLPSVDFSGSGPIE